MTRMITGIWSLARLRLLKVASRLLPDKSIGGVRSTSYAIRAEWEGVRVQPSVGLSLEVTRNAG